VDGHVLHPHLELDRGVPGGLLHGGHPGLVLVTQGEMEQQIVPGHQTQAAQLLLQRPGAFGRLLGRGRGGFFLGQGRSLSRRRERRPLPPGRPWVGRRYPGRPGRDRVGGSSGPWSHWPWRNWPDRWDRRWVSPYGPGRPPPLPPGPWGFQRPARSGRQCRPPGCRWPGPGRSGRTDKRCFPPSRLGNRCRWRRAPCRWR